MQVPVPLFDAHCDTITAAMKKGEGLWKNSLHLDLERLLAYSPCAQVFAIFTRPEEDSAGGAWDFDRPDAPAKLLYGLYQKAAGYLLEEFDKNGDILMHCLTADDVRQARRENKIAAFISVEGAELLACDLEKLREAYDLGVRLVNITWNYPNSLSGTAMSSNNGGLTEKGRAFVRGAQEMGVILDMSHISEAAFWDTLDIASRPVLASHSNSKTLCPHPRNLSDDQFVVLVKLGGAAGLNLCPDFLGLGRDAVAVVEHAEHFLALGGEKAVCLGADLDGIDELPEGIRGVEHMGKIYEAMLRRNYNEDLVRDIFYNNLLGVFERAL
ncbi:MAG: dipeptidase [Oscillospiraceae bacterium]|jgi:membrane dipeptidase